MNETHLNIPQAAHEASSGPPSAIARLVQSGNFCTNKKYQYISMLIGNRCPSQPPKADDAMISWDVTLATEL